MSSTRASRVHGACAAMVLAGTIAGGTVRADDADPRTADALFDQGKALLDRDRVSEACERLRDSYRLDPALGTLGLLAWCHERQGKIATAWREYHEVAELESKAKAFERESVARRRALALQKDVSTMRIDVVSAVPGLQVLVGEQSVPQGSWGKAMAMDPGEVTITARAPERVAWTRTVTIGTPGDAVAVRIPELARTRAPIPVAVEHRPLPSRPQETGSRSWTPPVVAFGLGAAGLIVGSVYGLRAISKNDASSGHCDASNACDPEGGSLRDEARSFATISTIGFGVGLAGAAAGTYLWLRGAGQTRKEASTRPKTGIAPLTTPGGAGLSMIGRF